MLEALSKVPRKIEKAWIPTNEVTLDQLKAWEAEFDSKEPIRRVGFPLFNLDRDGRAIESQKVAYVKGRDALTGNLYLYRYWPSRPEDAEIQVMVARDLQTGETSPWRHYDYD